MTTTDDDDYYIPDAKKGWTITTKLSKHKYGLLAVLLLRSGLHPHPGPTHTNHHQHHNHNIHVDILSHNITSLTTHINHVVGQAFDVGCFQEISIPTQKLQDIRHRLREHHIHSHLTPPDPELLHTTGGVAILGRNR
eukprot:9779080-Karenia_brevis.AAC.1